MTHVFDLLQNVIELPAYFLALEAAMLLSRYFVLIIYLTVRTIPPHCSRNQYSDLPQLLRKRVVKGKNCRARSRVKQG